MKKFSSPILLSVYALLTGGVALSTSANTDLDRGLVIGVFTVGVVAFGYWLADTDK